MTSSFQLVRTNVLLTSNYKLVFTLDDKIYLESFNSNKELSKNKYKHKLISHDSFLTEKLRDFYNGLAENLAFEVKNSRDIDVVHTELSKQFDDTYYAGASIIEDKRFEEEFEYLAPLHVSKFDLPEAFIILRVDGDGVLTDDDGNYTSISADNFRNEIIDNMKCVKIFDLTSASKQGFFIRNNVSERLFPYTTLDLTWHNAGFLTYSGIDYIEGQWASKSSFIQDYLKYEHPYFRMEEFITEGYRKNKLIYPYLWNLKFLFSDQKYTFESHDKYSINRYYGFYIKEIKTLHRYSPYIPLFELKENDNGDPIQLIDNKFVAFVETVLQDGFETPVYRNVDPISGGWNQSHENLYYMFLKNNSGVYGYYKLTRIVNQENEYEYLLLSEELLENIEDINVPIKIGKGSVKIEYRQGEDGQLRNYIMLYDWEDKKFNIHASSSIEKSINPETMQPLIDLYDINGNVVDEDSYMNINTLPVFSNSNKRAVYFDTLDAYDIKAIYMNGAAHVLQEDSQGLLYVNVDGRFIFTSENWQYIVNQEGILENEEKIESLSATSAALRARLTSANEEEYQNILSNIQTLNREISTLRNEINQWRTVTPLSNLGRNTEPQIFEIKAFSLLDIKDFDFARKETKFAEYEYMSEDKPDEYSFLANLFLNDWSSDSKPRPIRLEPQFDPRLERLIVKDNIVDFTKEDNKAIPSSSEYATSEELFEIRNGYLTKLWFKNQEICKWGWAESIHKSDYPYRLNNNNASNERNMGPEPFITRPAMYLNNLEHCYYNYDQISNFQLQNKKTTIHIPAPFNLDGEDGYMTADFDYFSHFFEDKFTFSDYSESYDLVENQKKYSNVNIYQIGLPNRTLFRNCMFEFLKPQGYQVTPDLFVENMEGTNFYQTEYDITGYKFSILFKFDPLDEIIEDNIDSSILDNEGELNALISRDDFSLPPIPHDYENKVDYDIFLNHKHKNILLLIRCYKHPIEDQENNPLNIPDKSNLNVENERLFSWYETEIRSNSQQQAYFDREKNTFAWIDSIGNTRPGPYYIQDNEVIEFENDWKPLLFNPLLVELEQLTTASLINTINTRGYYLNEASDFRLWEIKENGTTVFSKRWNFKGYKAVGNPKLSPKNMSRQVPDRAQFEPLDENSLMPFFIDAYHPHIFDMNLNSYITDPEVALFNIDLNSENTLFPKAGRQGLGLDVNYYYGDVLGRKITPKTKNQINVSGRANSISSRNYIETTRYSGSYFPIFYDIPLFKKDNISETKNNPNNYNNKFDESLTGFGEIKELPRHKVNLSQNILKLKTNNTLSIYPRIDEFGVDFEDRFMFLSNWDVGYFKQYKRKQ